MFGSSSTLSTGRIPSTAPLALTTGILVCEVSLNATNLLFNGMSFPMRATRVHGTISLCTVSDCIASTRSASVICSSLSTPPSRPSLKSNPNLLRGDGSISDSEPRTTRASFPVHATTGTIPLHHNALSVHVSGALHLYVQESVCVLNKSFGRISPKINSIGIMTIALTAIAIHGFKDVESRSIAAPKLAR